MTHTVTITATARPPTWTWTCTCGQAATVPGPIPTFDSGGTMAELFPGHRDEGGR